MHSNQLMRYFFLCLTLCFTVSSFSQLQKKIDSLYEVYEKADDPLKKHTVFYDIGRLYVGVNLDSATSILSQTIAEAKQFKNDSLILKSQLGMALALSRMSKNDSARYYYSASEQILKDFQHSELQKTLYINRGILFFYERKYDQAGDEFQRALDEIGRASCRERV